jgi:hypothetical protein
MSELDKAIELLKKGKLVTGDYGEDCLMFWNENSKGEYEAKEIKQAIDILVSTIEQLRDNRRINNDMYR